jgi:CrcB protein
VGRSGDDPRIDPPVDPPIDPDVGPADVAEPPHWPVVLAVGIGGVGGALARYGAQRAWPTHGAGLPWTTLTVNVLGCALLGVLLVLVTERGAVNRLWRPLLGTGVLGGFTTFSTYSVDLQRDLAAGRGGQALGYGAGTLVGAVVAVTLATAATRRLVAPR